VVGAALLAAWGVFVSLRGHAPERGVMERQPTTSAPPPPQPPPEPAAPAPTEAPGAGVRLPDGKTLDAPPDSAQADLARTLSDGAARLPRSFRFDALKFETGSATLPAGARKTIDDLATTLRAYPAARVRIDGYTDDAGDDPTNQKLSQARANTIKKDLVAKGVSGDRIETTASGARGRVAPNDSDQGRSLNRRSEIVLLRR
jgi:outer membrane protein OmpA-like peptidoglycan-associated protein